MFSIFCKRSKIYFRTYGPMISTLKPFLIKIIILFIMPFIISFNKNRNNSIPIQIYYQEIMLNNTIKFGPLIAILAHVLLIPWIFCGISNSYITFSINLRNKSPNLLVTHNLDILLSLLAMMFREWTSFYNFQKIPKFVKKIL